MTYEFKGQPIKVDRNWRKPRKCECGCKLRFVPWQRRQRFVDALHKARWHNNRRKSKAS